MKKNKLLIVLMIAAALSPADSFAQVASIEKSLLNTNLFKEFLHGTVLMKDGRIEKALLNYDTENQSIVFNNKEQVLVLTGLSSVDTVYIQNRKFVPHENSFYEVLTTAGVGLYATYTNKRKPVTASPDHDGTKRGTGIQVSNSVAPAYVSRPNQLNYTVEILTQYWLKRGNSIYKANNEKQLLKVFPFKSNELIKNYIQENKIDFDKPEDLIKLVAYCNTQVK